MHGRDNEAKETAAGFLERLGLKPIILHEQPSSGQTIIEKFEVYSEDIGFAIVLPRRRAINNYSSEQSDPHSRMLSAVVVGCVEAGVPEDLKTALVSVPVVLPAETQRPAQPGQERGCRKCCVSAGGGSVKMRSA